MAYFNKRSEHSRYPVTEDCRGFGVNLRNGHKLEYRGVDVSVHGFGCIVNSDAVSGDALALEISDQKFIFQVMWSESHLGIPNQTRVGLFLLDAQIDLEQVLQLRGLIRKNSR